MPFQPERLSQLHRLDLNSLIVGPDISIPLPKKVSGAKKDTMVSFLDVCATDITGAKLNPHSIDDLAGQKFNVDLHSNTRANVERAQVLIHDSRELIRNVFGLNLGSRINAAEIERIEDARAFFGTLLRTGQRDVGAITSVMTTLKGGLILEDMHRNPMFELAQKVAENLHDEFVDELGTTESLKKGEKLRTVYIPLHGADPDDLVLAPDGTMCLPIRMSYRKKTNDRTVIKMARKHGADSEEAVKDSIGFLFEIENPKYIAPFIEQFIIPFIKRRRGYVQEIKNNGLLDSAAFRECVTLVGKDRECRSGYEMPELKTRSRRRNKISDDGYAALSIIGECTPREGLTPRERANNYPFEIQIVPDDRQNEQGTSGHVWYELKALLSGVSRLYGFLPPSYIQKIRNIAGKHYSGVAEQAIDSEINRFIVETIGFIGTKRTSVKRTLDHKERCKELGLSV